MGKRVVVLANPSAGGGLAARLVEPLLTRLQAAGCTVRLIAARDAGEAEDLARGAVREGIDLLVALGGDGLVHVAVQVLAGTFVPLGVVPAGTGNDAARALGLPARPGGRHAMRAVDVILGGDERRIDLGEVQGRYFLTVLSSGFDGLVNERANRMRWPHGRAKFALAVAAELPHLRPLAYALRIDGRVVDVQALLVAVGNGPSYGGGMRICPEANLDDGWLAVTVVCALPTREFIRLFPSVYRGTHQRHPAVLTLRGRKVEITAPGMSAHADGEPLGSLQLEVTVARRALTVMAPVSPTVPGYRPNAVPGPAA
jgi:diacylglycerol kinase (ATP)